jgi:hypothetical protein
MTVPLVGPALQWASRHVAGNERQAMLLRRLT